MHDNARAHVSVGLRRRGGNISVDLSLLVLLYNANFMNKPKCKDFFILKTKNNSMTLQIFLKSTKSPHFPLRGNVGQLSERKRVLCWSIYVHTLLVYAVHILYTNLVYTHVEDLLLLLWVPGGCHPLFFLYIYI